MKETRCLPGLSLLTISLLLQLTFSAILKPKSTSMAPSLSGSQEISETDKGVTMALSEELPEHGNPFILENKKGPADLKEKNPKERELRGLQVQNIGDRPRIQRKRKLDLDLRNGNQTRFSNYYFKINLQTKIILGNKKPEIIFLKI